MVYENLSYTKINGRAFVQNTLPMKSGPEYGDPQHLLHKQLTLS